MTVQHQQVIVKCLSEQNSLNWGGVLSPLFVFMKKIFILLFLLSLALPALGAEFIIEYPCYPVEVQRVFKKYGLQIDLDSNRSFGSTSWGFIKNEGSSFRIYSYYPPNGGELIRLKNIIMEYLREMKSYYENFRKLKQLIFNSIRSNNNFYKKFKISKDFLE